jgi:hypothetical protein
MQQHCACGETNPAKFSPLSKKECLACKAARRARRVRPAAPKVRPRPERVDEKKHPEHLSWVRSQACAVYLCGNRDIHAHHVRAGTGGGTGMKPGDEWAVSLCSRHHMEIHSIGCKSFEKRYQTDLRKLAIHLASSSPCLKKKA